MSQHLIQGFPQIDPRAVCKNSITLLKRETCKILGTPGVQRLGALGLKKPVAAYSGLFLNLINMT